MRHLPKHALIHVVDPSFIDPSCLNKETVDTYQTVQWTEHAAAGDIKEYAGQHRTAALKATAADLFNQLKIVEKKLVKKPAEPNWLAEKASILEELKEQTWLVAYYSSEYFFLTSHLFQFMVSL